MLGRSMWVTCDGAPGEECDEEVTEMGPDATGIRVRNKARKLGWTRDARGLDLCPVHAEVERLRPAAGGSVRDVARTGGISTSTVQTWTKEKQ